MGATAGRGLSFGVPQWPDVYRHKGHCWVGSRLGYIGGFMGICCLECHVVGVCCLVMVPRLELSDVWDAKVDVVVYRFGCHGGWGHLPSLGCYSERDLDTICFAIVGSCVDCIGCWNEGPFGLIPPKVGCFCWLLGSYWAAYRRGPHAYCCREITVEECHNGRG